MRGLWAESEEKRSEIGQVVDSDIRFAAERSQCTWLAASDRSPRAVSFLRKPSAIIQSFFLFYLSFLLSFSFLLQFTEKNALQRSSQWLNRSKVTLCACCIVSRMSFLKHKMSNIVALCLMDGIYRRIPHVMHLRQFESKHVSHVVSQKKLSVARKTDERFRCTCLSWRLAWRPRLPARNHRSRSRGTRKKR